MSAIGMVSAAVTTLVIPRISMGTSPSYSTEAMWYYQLDIKGVGSKVRRQYCGDEQTIGKYLPKTGDTRIIISRITKVIQNGDGGGGAIAEAVRLHQHWQNPR